jgi:hypothetical protein
MSDKTDSPVTSVRGAPSDVPEGIEITIEVKHLVVRRPFGETTWWPFEVVFLDGTSYIIENPPEPLDELPEYAALVKILNDAAPQPELYDDPDNGAS